MANLLQERAAYLAQCRGGAFWRRDHRQTDIADELGASIYDTRERLIDQLEYRPISEIRDELDALDNVMRPGGVDWLRLIATVGLTILVVWLVGRE